MSPSRHPGIQTSGLPAIRPVKPARPIAREGHAQLPWDVPTWHLDALCAQTDPDAFFPEKGGSTREAKAVCRACTVTVECLAYALANTERHGIWGGLSERERRKLAGPNTCPDCAAPIARQARFCPPCRAQRQRDTQLRSARKKKAAA